MIGLTSREAEIRRAEGLGNSTQKRMLRSTRSIVQSHVFTYFNFINAVLFLFVCSTGKYRNGLFMLTVLFNTVSGILQEIRAKRQLERMRLLVQSTVEVLRDGQWKTLSTDELVNGDVFKLHRGLQVPADCLVLQGSVEVDESILTGEPEYILKQEGSKVLSGSTVVSGSCVCEAIACGSHCFAAGIEREAGSFRPSVSVLATSFTKMLKLISIVLIPLGLALFYVQTRNADLSNQEAILKTVSALVGMIPEGLIVLVTVALLVSTIRLADRQVLVQDLYAIEAMARCDVLCLDKTGTLTSNKLRVTELKSLCEINEKDLSTLLGDYAHVFGKEQATNAALVERFAPANRYKPVDVLPFHSARKFSAVSFEGAGTWYLGAAEFLLSGQEEQLRKEIQVYTGKGYRVLTLAHRAGTLLENPSDLTPVALVVLEDELRGDAQTAVDYLQKQGIRLMVLSGDDADTVSALAGRCGIMNADQKLDMSQNPNLQQIQSASVFGRVVPAQKKEIIQTLQAQGHIVAMIGDGVNDVPALKTADVGIAMASGASAARDSANIVLLDNAFAQVRSIVHEGRRVLNNITRASSMYLVKTSFSFLLSVYILFRACAYPFLPIHLTIISAFCVGIPTFILQMEPSFERVQGHLLFRALRFAIPSALTVLAAAIILEETGQEGMQTILYLWTAWIYFLTLFRVYAPPSRLRVSVVCLMLLGFVSVSYGLSSFLDLNVSKESVHVLLIGVFVIPVVLLVVNGLFSLLKKR